MTGGRRGPASTKKKKREIFGDLAELFQTDRRGVYLDSTTRSLMMGMTWADGESMHSVVCGEFGRPYESGPTFTAITCENKETAQRHTPGRRSCQSSGLS
jgi:hypothetical protein